MVYTKFKIAAVASAAALVAVGVGVSPAGASIPAPDGTITACYKTPVPDHGTPLNLINTAGGSCANGSVPLTWNQQGPAGPAGPQGPAGAPGVQGPAGSPGVSGYEVDTYTPSANDNPRGSFTADNSHDALVQLYCPAGKVALGSGFSQPVAQLIDILRDYPFSDASGSGWKWTFNGDPPGQYTVYVTCATAS